MSLYYFLHTAHATPSNLLKLIFSSLLLISAMASAQTNLASKYLPPIVDLVLNNGQDTIAVQSIQLHATFHNVGIQVNFEGDNNNNATALLEANINGAGFALMHPLSKVFLVPQPPRVDPQRFVGSVFSVPPQSQVTVRVTVSDPDGVTNSVQTASIITRSKQIPQSSGASIHIAMGGSDISGNGSTGAPFASIQHGVDQAGPGDTILIHAGTYHQRIEIANKQISPNQAFLTVKSAGDGPVILDGTDPDLVNAGAWSSEGNNVYSAPLNNAPNNETYYVGFDGNRMWKYLSLLDLQNLIHATNGGFYTDPVQNKIFVKFPGNVAPAGHQISVSNLKYAFELFNVNNIVIDGLTIKNYNSAEHAASIHVADNSHSVWIVNNLFEHSETAIRLEAEVVDLVVMGNEFSDQGILNFDWDKVKEHQHWLERGALYCSNDEYSGSGIIFYDNFIHELFDGVKIVGNEILSYASNADVEKNRFERLADDGVETDGYSSNVRIQNNRFEEMLIGVSVAPALAGPTYINRNLMVDLKNTAGSDFATGAVKFSFDGEAYGDMFIYHNTGSTTEANREAFSVSNDAAWSMLTMKNNIWSGQSYGMYYFLDNAHLLDTIQDFDLLFASSGIAAQYQGEDYFTIPAYFSASGLCEHCIKASPNFVDQAAGDYHLKPTSPAINQGLLIPGINNLDSSNNNPDIGAFEL